MIHTRGMLMATSTDGSSLDWFSVAMLRASMAFSLSVSHLAFSMRSSR